MTSDFVPSKGVDRRDRVAPSFRSTALHACAHRVWRVRIWLLSIAKANAVLTSRVI